MKEWNGFLKWSREKCNLTLREVENQTGISNGYLSQVETGKIDNPGFFKICKILTLYGVGIESFYKYFSEKKKRNKMGLYILYRKK